MRTLNLKYLQGILVLNIGIGLIHAMAHYFENILDLSLFDLIFIISFQFLIPAILLGFLTKDQEYTRMYLFLGFFSFTVFFLYSLFSHFIILSPGQIHLTPDSFTGQFYDVSTLILAFVQLGAIFLFTKELIRLNSKNFASKS